MKQFSRFTRMISVAALTVHFVTLPVWAADGSQNAETAASASGGGGILMVLLIAALVVIAALLVCIIVMMKNNQNPGQRNTTQGTAERGLQSRGGWIDDGETEYEGDKGEEETRGDGDEKEDPDKTQLVSTVKIRLTDKRDPTITIVEELDRVHSALLIGRSAAADIVIDEGTVSRKHCKIIWEDEKFFVVNHSGKNGTKVGKEQTTEIGTRLPLCPGDEIVMGNVIFVFSVVQGEG